MMCCKGGRSYGGIRGIPLVGLPLVLTQLNDASKSSGFHSKDQQSVLRGWLKQMKVNIVHHSIAPHNPESRSKTEPAGDTTTSTQVHRG